MKARLPLPTIQLMHHDDGGPSPPPDARPSSARRIKPMVPSRPTTAPAGRGHLRYTPSVRRFRRSLADALQKHSPVHVNPFSLDATEQGRDYAQQRRRRKQIRGRDERVAAAADAAARTAADAAQEANAKADAGAEVPPAADTATTVIADADDKFGKIDRCEGLLISIPMRGEGGLWVCAAAGDRCFQLGWLPSPRTNPLAPSKSCFL